MPGERGVNRLQNLNSLLVQIKAYRLSVFENTNYYVLFIKQVTLNSLTLGLGTTWN